MATARSVYHVGSVCASNAHSTQRSVLANGEDLLLTVIDGTGPEVLAAKAAEAELRECAADPQGLSQNGYGSSQSHLLRIYGGPPFRGTVNNLKSRHFWLYI